MAEIEASLDSYCSSYEKTAKEILEGLDEGFNEGLREGIKQGFIACIKECRSTGFDNIEVKCMEEVLKNACRAASYETMCVTVKQAVSNEYREKISPSFKREMEKACDKAVEEIKNTDFELEKRFASDLKSCVDASVRKIKDCIGNTCGDIRKNIPADVIFLSFFDGLQDEFSRDLDENLEACEKRICKEIDSKIESRRVDYEGH